MGNKSKFDRAGEVYKCIVLTVIAIILLFIWSKRGDSVSSLIC